MVVIKIAVRNILRKPKQTILLGSLILIGMALVFLSNAIFEGTRLGLKKSYAGSLTADIVIAEENPFTTSIFGNDMPLVGDYQATPPLSFFPKIEHYLTANARIKSWTPVISTIARLEYEDFRDPVHLFGIDTESYFKTCPEIDYSKVNLELLQPGKRGLSINAELAQQISKEIGRDLEIGDELQLTFSTEGSFNIEKAIFAGVHAYTSEITPFNRLVLSDPVLLRELINFANIQTVNYEDFEQTDDLTDLGALFFDETEDFDTENESLSFLETIEQTLSEQKIEEIDPNLSNGLWNFVLIKAKPHTTSRLEQNLKLIEKKEAWNTKILNWKIASGINSQAAFALQIAFNFGIVIVIVAAILVLMNGLIISVLERMNEIGTMRSIGAQKIFIAKLFFSESLIMIIFFSLVGLGIGIFLAFTILYKHIPLGNELLMSLFGGKTLKPLVTMPLIFAHITGAIMISILSWMYPVFIALRIVPAQIMGKNA